MTKLVLLLILLALSRVGIAGGREGRTFETRGTAVVFTSSTFTIGKINGTFRFLPTLMSKVIQVGAECRTTVPLGLGPSAAYHSNPK